jgi:hypothetical protein
LEQERWLTRTVVSDRPFRVSYSLTSLGRKIANLSTVIGIVILFLDEPKSVSPACYGVDKSTNQERREIGRNDP